MRCMGVVAGSKQEEREKNDTYQPYLPLICYRYHQLISQPCMQPGLLFERQTDRRTAGGDGGRVGGQRKKLLCIRFQAV